MKRKITLESGRTVESWYDRKSRNWVTQLKENGNQVCDAEFSGTKNSVTMDQRIQIEKDHKLGPIVQRVAATTGPIKLTGFRG
jgi:hypothetical protein